MAGTYFTHADLDHLCKLVDREVDHTQAQVKGADEDKIHFWAERTSFNSEILRKLRKVKAEAAAWERERAARSPVEARFHRAERPPGAAGGLV